MDTSRLILYLSELLSLGFFSSSLGLGSLSRSLSRSLDVSLLRTRTTCALGLLLTGLGVGVLVEVNELYHAHLGVVTQTVARLEDTHITTGTVCNLVGDYTEQFLDGLVVLQIAEHQTAVSGIVLLGTGDQRLGIHAECLRLGLGCEDALVCDQSNRKIREERLAMALLAAQVVEFLIMSHR